MILNSKDLTKKKINIKQLNYGWLNYGLIKKKTKTRKRLLNLKVQEI